MGLLDKIKSAAKKAKCGIGIHGGTYATPEGKPKCYLEKTCPDCGKVITQDRHEYPMDWENAPYAEDDLRGCMRTQKCIHCEKEERRIVHSEFQDCGKNMNCQEVKRCLRCGYEELGREEHSFVQDGKTEDGKIIMRCLNCHKREIK